MQDELAKALAPRGEDLLAEVKLGLDDALRPVITDAHERSEAAELLIVRTWLRELDSALALLRNKTAQLRAVGVQSARKLAERLEAKSRLERPALRDARRIDHRVPGHRPR